ncbi:MAG: 4-hydroxy-tetrahydrodipicolinate synthase [Ruminococcaceae bacterium]|nr:4-hydroxy-tetrahydrodipicolinate synthase [Oscillospiraceae bacterium]
MKPVIFEGAGVAIVTPFTETGIDFDKLGELIDFQIENSTDAIIICGTTGEAATMPDREHLSAIEYTVNKVAGRVPVIAGTGSNDTVHGMHLSSEAKRLGADALLLVTPYYNKTNPKGLIAHFDAMASAGDLPVILYNVPGRTGMNIPLDVIKELNKRDYCVAIKEASGNISYVAEIAASCPDLTIYSGNDDMIVPVMSLGGKGVISVLSNIMPKETHDICELYAKGQVKESAALQLKLLEVINSLFCEVNPIPVKTALNLMGMNVGKLRMPLCDMADKNLNRLKDALKGVGLI